MNEPRHIAIIMDGNGRWAHKRGLPRIAGHKAGVTSVHKIVHHANIIGLKYLTLFAFSSENWKRPKKEVLHLLELLEYFVRQDLKELNEANVHIKVIGDRENLSAHLKRLLDEAETLTKENTGLHLNVAFNYGGRDEIYRAAKRFIKNFQHDSSVLENFTQKEFESFLDTKDIPDPDLIIRTGGEFRLSNFLLWQSAYSELYFCDKYWPEFKACDLDEAIKAYHNRERRFGKIMEKEKS